LDEENDYVLKGIYMYILGTDHCSIWCATESVPEISHIPTEKSFSK
jgi:hypothetical protein